MATFREVLIDLTTNETYDFTPDPENYPTITHTRLVAWKREICRNANQCEGSLIAWFAKGYIYNGKFVEAYNFPGYNPDLEIIMPEIQTFGTTQIQSGDEEEENCKLISQYMIDSERISGTVVINEYTE